MSVSVSRRCARRWRRGVAAARAELEERLERAVDVLAEEPEDHLRLVGVLLGRREQVEPVRQLVVHREPVPGCAVGSFHGSAS